jgi:hypothetical protein
MDPLGLTEDQRMRSELVEAFENFLATVKRNLETLDELPDGTIIKGACYPGCPGHPVEVYR